MSKNLKYVIGMSTGICFTAVRLGLFGRREIYLPKNEYIDVSKINFILFDEVNYWDNTLTKCTHFTKYSIKPLIIIRE